MALRFVDARTRSSALEHSAGSIRDAVFRQANCRRSIEGAPLRPNWLEIPEVDPSVDPHRWEVCGERWVAGMGGNPFSDLGSDLKLVSTALQIRGLPREDPAPPAPYRGQSNFFEIPVTLLNLFGVVRLIGAHAFAYGSENSGRIFRDVVARDDAREEYSSQGWALELPWHSDCAYRPLTEESLIGREGLSPAPRWLVFGVIYDSPRVPMIFTPVADVVARLSNKSVRALLKPEFNVASPQSFASSKVTHGVAILLADGAGGFFARLNQVGCSATTLEARRALSALSAVLAEPQIKRQIALKSGDVIVLDNWRSFHMRSAYQPKWDGSDRWLIRLYASPCGAPSICDEQLLGRMWK
jgi:L-asparagine oxygenase